MLRKLSFITPLLCLFQIGLPHVARAQDAASQLGDCLSGFQAKPYNLFAWTQGSSNAMCFLTLDAIKSYLKSSSCGAQFKCDRAATPYYSNPGGVDSIGHPSGICRLPNGDTAGISLDIDYRRDGTAYNRYTSALPFLRI